VGWQDLLLSSDHLVAPWLGGRRVYRDVRAWKVEGRLPREFGWYLWEIRGRSVKQREEHEADPDYGEGSITARGYLVGDRFIPEKARVDPEPDKLVEQTVPVYLVEPGLDRFAPVQVIFDAENRPIYKMELFPSGAEEKVREAFIAKKETIEDVPGVTPALDLAFRFATRQRQLLEAHRAELERRRVEEERREQARRNMGTGLGRRTMAAMDFEAGARAALAVGGAELLDVRPGRGRNEMVVQYRFENRRLECVARKDTLQIVDSGICLTDHRTDEKGDTYFTLESLPAVVRQAIQEHKLVVYRHVDGDFDDDDWED